MLNIFMEDNDFPSTESNKIYINSIEISKLG